MKELSLERMEGIEGGDIGCAFATVGLIAAYAGLFTLTVATGGVALIAAVAGAVVAPAGWGLSCFGE